jgi:uroporphyrinogen decarboxylase
MYGEPELWSQLLDRLATITLAFLRVQIDAGASAVQLFDSWVGALPAADYRAYVQPHSARCWPPWRTCRASTSASAPASCCTTWARRARTSSASTGGCRCRTAVQRIGPGKAVQGNLDPTLVFAPLDVVERKVQDALEEGKAAEGHVFNLGHGVLPETDPDVLLRVVELVHAGSQRP